MREIFSRVMDSIKKNLTGNQFFGVNLTEEEFDGQSGIHRQYQGAEKVPIKLLIQPVGEIT